MAKNLASILGLSEKQGIVYQAILQGGALTQSDIARRTNINRTSLYSPLKQLLQKDLISKSLKGKRLIYRANNPQKLLSNASAAYKSLEAMLPDLIHTYRTVNSKPIFTLRDGAEGIYHATMRAAEKGFYIKAFSSPSNFLSVLTRQDASKIIAVIEKRGIKSTTLTSHDSKNLKTVETFPSPNLEWRPMPPGISYPVEFLLYNNTTVVTSWQNRFAVEIESADITRFVESLFDYFWKLGRK